MANKNKSELGAIFKQYIPKDIFLHKLSLDEVRLCVFLTSKINKTLSNMTYEEKRWCVGGQEQKITKLKSAEQHLIELDLIQPNGLGHCLSGKQYCVPRPDLLYSCKTSREIFILCLDYWYVGGSYTSVGKDYIYAQLGEDTRNRNRNIKRLKKSLNIDFSLEERENDFLYKKITKAPCDLAPPIEDIVEQKEYIIPTINVKSSINNTPLQPSMDMCDIEQYLNMQELDDFAFKD